MVAPLAHFLGMVWFQVYGGVSAILGNEYAIRGKNFVARLQERYCENGPATGILCWVYDVLGELYLTRLSGLMSSKADQQTSVQAISDRFPERRPPNFDIVKPLAKSKGAGTEDLILFFRWLGVFYLLAGGCQWHGAKFCMGQLKFHLICLVKNMSKNYRTNLCASLED